MFICSYLCCAKVHVHIFAVQRYMFILSHSEWYILVMREPVMEKMTEREIDELIEETKINAHINPVTGEVEPDHTEDSDIVVKETVHIFDKKYVQDNMPDEDSLIDISDLFKIFGDSSRIRILFALLAQPLTVNEMVEILGIEQSVISHHMKILKDNHLVKFERYGKSKLYTLSDLHVSSILNMGLSHISE